MLYNQSGVLIGMTHVMLPYMVLTLLASMSRVPPQLVPAARTLGAGPLRAFTNVFLPLTMPGVLAGVMMTFIFRWASLSCLPSWAARSKRQL
nr:ABC transporter permease subunit [Roseicyclus sp.]